MLVWDRTVFENIHPHSDSRWYFGVTFPQFSLPLQWTFKRNIIAPWNKRPLKRILLLCSVIIKHHAQISSHRRARKPKKNTMLEPTRIPIFAGNGEWCNLSDKEGIEGQQHLFRSCHEVGGSWNYLNVIFLLLAFKWYFLYQWGQEVVNLEVMYSIKYLAFDKKSGWKCFRVKSNFLFSHSRH